MVWKICIQQLILKNHKISKEGKDPKEIELTKSNHKEQGKSPKNKNSKRKQRVLISTCSLNTDRKHRQHKS